MTMRPSLLTYGEMFHCEEALAYATLKLAFGLQANGHDHRLSRTRDR